MKQSNWMARALLAGASALFCAGAVQAAPYIEPSAYVTAAAPAQPVRFEVFLPLRDKAGLDSLLDRQQDKAAADYHKWLTPTQFKTRFGPSAESRARTIAALKAQGFTVSAEHTRSFEVTGTASMVAHAFSTSLLHVQPKTGVARLVANTPLVIPAALKAEGAMVVAFLGLPPHHHFSIHVPISNPENRYSAHGPYWFDDLKQAYDYPSYQTTYNNRTLDGTGVKVAVVIDADVRDSDVTAYFEEEHFAAKSGKGADPAIVHDYVDGGSALDTDGEATLDVEQVLGGAPGATVGLVNVPDLSDGSITAGYIHVIEGNYYDLVNSSFGECELIFSPPYNGGSTAAESVIQIYHSPFSDL